MFTTADVLEMHRRMPTPRHSSTRSRSASVSERSTRRSYWTDRYNDGTVGAVAEELGMAIDRQQSPYRRGNRFDRLPIPMVPEHCTSVDAGAVQLVVESRTLTNAIIEDTFHDGVEVEVPFDDFGATLHVCGTSDGMEHLRFDCFEHEPHYHYIEQAAGANTVVRIDELAVGDPVDFSLACVEHHLPDMLRRCGVADLADEVAGRPDKVHAAVVEVRELMKTARSPVA